MKPWYRELWPWLIISGPAAVLVAGAVTTWIAFASADGLVAEDYYKQGLGINRRLAREDAARKLGISAAIRIAAIVRSRRAARFRAGGAVPASRPRHSRWPRCAAAAGAVAGRRLRHGIARIAGRALACGNRGPARDVAHRQGGVMRQAIAILWPSFIFGGIGAVLFFTLHDPVDLSFVGPLEFGRKAGYTVGFFLFWGSRPARAGSPGFSRAPAMRAASLLFLLLPAAARGAGRRARPPALPDLLRRLPLRARARPPAHRGEGPVRPARHGGALGAADQAQLHARRARGHRPVPQRIALPLRASAEKKAVNCA